MQIFAIHSNPKIAARQLCDKHVVKMIVESAQLLSSVHHKLDTKYKDDLYKLTHQHHPCARWLLESKSNYRWLLTHFEYMLKEYTHRYGKVHLTSRLLPILENVPNELPDTALTNFAQAFDDKYKSNNAVISYRKFYVCEKSDFCKWTKRAKPWWYDNYLVKFKNIDTK